MNTRWIFRACASFAVFVLLLMMGSTFMSAQKSDSEEINRAITQAKNEAVLVDADAETLHSWTMSQISWELHASKLNSMKEHVNELGKIHQQLGDLRSEGSPWQQEAIDRINPLISDMADQLSATIKHLNDHKNQLQFPAYRDYTHACYDLASRTSSMIRDFAEYAEAKSRSEDLERKLELPAGN